jgi:hypothetical protein
MPFIAGLLKRYLPNLPKIIPKMPFSSAKLHWQKENITIILVNNRGIFMGKQVKRIVNLILAAIGLAMGVAVVVMTIINADVTIDELVRLLAIGVTSLGIFALNNIHKHEQ